MRAWCLSWMLACTGCAELRNALAPPKPQAQQVQVQTPVPSPKCPERIPQEEPLEAVLVHTLGPRSFVPDLTLPRLGFQGPEGPEVRSSFQSQLSLADGPVELVGVTLQSGAGLMFLRPGADGYCVVNTWSTWQSAEVQYTLDSSWTSPDGRMAILLMKVVVAPGGAPGSPSGRLPSTSSWCPRSACDRRASSSTST
jgi:hypothetical protein